MADSDLQQRLKQEYRYSSPYQEILLSEGIVRIGSRILEGSAELTYYIYQAYFEQNFLNLLMSYNGFRDTFMMNRENTNILLKKNDCPEISRLINRKVIAYRSSSGRILGIQDTLVS